MFTNVIKDTTAVYSNASGCVVSAKILDTGLVPNMYNTGDAKCGLVQLQDDAGFLELGDDDEADVYFKLPSQDLLFLYAAKNELDREGVLNLQHRIGADYLLEVIPTKILIDITENLISIDRGAFEENGTAAVNFEAAGPELVITAAEVCYDYTFRYRGFDYRTEKISQYEIKITADQLQAYAAAGGIIEIYMFFDYTT